MPSEKRKQWYEEWKRRPHVLARREEYRLSRHRHYLYSNARARARRLGLPFTITLADVVIPACCPALGIPIVVGVARGRSGKRDDSPSIDRIDNSKGYVPSNVIVVSMKANQAKNDLSVEELERLAAFYRAKLREVMA